MIENKIKIRMLYAYTDKMGIVYYGRYYEFFEAGRNNLLRDIGYPYTLLEEKNIALPVIESGCKYYSPAKYDDEIEVITKLNDIPGVRIKLEYFICKENLLLANGYTIHSFVNINNLKPIRPPIDFLNLIKKKFL